jgi:general secretion pathway protein L
LTVTLTLLPKTAVKPALQQLAGVGLFADRLELSEKPDPSRAGPVVALDDGRPVSGGGAFPLWPAYGLAGLALLALLSLAGLALWQGALEAQLRSARQQAHVTRALAADIAAIRRRQHFPLLKRQDVMPAIAALDALSHALPDDSWAEEVDMAGGRIEVIGVSADAARLLSLLDQGGFTAAEFRAPVTPAEGGGQKYHLAALIADKAEPSRAAR